MKAVAKTELGITDIIVFDVKTRAELGIPSYYEVL